MDLNIFKPYATNEDFTKKNGQKKILGLPVDQGGCGWYRIRALFRKMTNTGRASCCILDSQTTEDRIRQAIIIADVIVARGGTLLLQKTIREMFPHKRIIFDHDDNTFVTLPSNENYRDTGTEDVWVTMDDGTKKGLWVTGVTERFNKFKNRRGLEDMREQMFTADLCTAPTERLAAVWKEQNPKVAVVHNLIDFDFYPDVQIHSHPEIRIGWQGGISHPGDFIDIAPTFSKFLRNDVYFYSIGAFFKELFPPETNEKNIKLFPWVDPMAHSYRMRLFDLDIAIIPLQDVPFNYFKSEIKFSEFAALRVPTLTKRLPPYEGIVKEEETGLMYDTPEEFKDQLTRLIQDKKLRKRLSDNAYEWVKKNRNMELELDNILDTWIG